MDLSRHPANDSTRPMPRHDEPRPAVPSEAMQRGACAAAEWRWFWRHYGWQHDD